MTVSFVSVAVVLWLGFVAAAGLHQVWRAVTNHPNLYGNRDYQRNSRDENNRNYRHRNTTSEGLFPIAYRSVEHILRALTNALRATFSRGVEWMRKMWRRSGTVRSSADQSSGAPVGTSEAGTGYTPVPAKIIPDGEGGQLRSLPVLGVDSSLTERAQNPVRRKNGSRVNKIPPRLPAGFAEKKRTTRRSNQTAKTRCQSPPQNEQKTQPATKTEVVASELAKAHSEKQNKKASGSGASQANKSTRTNKPKKRSPVSSVPLASKVTV
jgi:hypothetical protein